MTNFPKYNLSESAVRDIAAMITGETGGTDVLACRQEASQLANLNEVTKKRGNTEKELLLTLHSGWYSSNSWKHGITQTAIDAVKFVFIEGKRVLPRYVTEHDTFPIDLISPKARSNYVRGDVIKNVYGATYYFYDFMGSGRDGDICGYFLNDYYNYKDDEPYTEGDVKNMNAIDKVIAIAENEVGYLEKQSNSRLDSKTDNAGYNNYCKYWRDIKPSYQGQPWCACFVTWCFVQAFGKERAALLLKHYPFVYCPAMVGLFKLNSNPKRGDIALFYRNGTYAHTGIVTSVNGDYFTTIEGNTSGGNTIVPNGGGVYKKGYYNSNLPGTKFVSVDWSLVGDETALPVWNETLTEINVDAKVIANVVIRHMPSENTDAIGELVWGDLVNIDAFTDNGWFKIFFSNLGMYGYIKQSDVELISVDKENNLEQILYALNQRGILSDVDMWRTKAQSDCNVFFLLQNILYYAETKKRGETAENDYDGIEENLWEMSQRKVISNIDLWRNYMQNDTNIYWLIRKAVYYFRTL